MFKYVLCDKDTPLGKIDPRGLSQQNHRQSTALSQGYQRRVFNFGDDDGVEFSQGHQSYDESVQARGGGASIIIR